MLLLQMMCQVTTWQHNAVWTNVMLHKQILHSQTNIYIRTCTHKVTYSYDCIKHLFPIFVHGPCVVAAFAKYLFT